MKKLIAILLMSVLVLGICCGCGGEDKESDPVADLCAKGEYQEAYEKAEDKEQQLEVFAENSAAILSAMAAKDLSTPESFKLVNAYFHNMYTEKDDHTTQRRMVLQIEGDINNGEATSGYWMYTFDVYEEDNEDKGWEYWISFESLEQDGSPSLDGLTIAVDVMRGTAQDIVDEDFKLSDDAVDRINKLFKKGELDDVELITDELKVSTVG